MVEVIAPVSAAVARELSPECRSEIEVIEIAQEAGWQRLAPASALHALCDTGSARGLAVARGAIIASLEDTAQPTDTWVMAAVDAHASHPHEVIGGPIDVEAGDAAAWAAFWLDFRPYVPPQRLGEVGGLSDVNVSYKRSALLGARDVWQIYFNEFLVHGQLRARGCRFLMLPEMAVTLRRPRRPLSTVLAERYHWGRVFGAAQRAAMPASHTAAHVLAVPVLPALIASRVIRKAARHPQHAPRLRRGWPALMACSTAWCAGELLGQVTGRPF
jgi:hypothetical protein